MSKELKVKENGLPAGLMPPIKTEIVKPEGFPVEQALSTVSKLKLTERERKILFAPVKEEDVEILPTGMIYLPWVWYAGRLNKAFGTQWALIPKGDPILKDDLILYGNYLFIKGHLMGLVYGECNYIPKNKRMSYGDAIEGAKSNALMRLCKGIGMGLELWNPTFIRKWIKKYAVYHYEEDQYGKKKKLWTKKESVEIPREMEKEVAPVSEKNTEEIEERDKLIEEIESLKPKLPQKTQKFIEANIKTASVDALKRWIKDAYAHIESVSKTETFNPETAPDTPIEAPETKKKKKVKVESTPNQQEFFNKLLKSHTLLESERDTFRDLFTANPSNAIELLKTKTETRRKVEKDLGFKSTQKCPAEILIEFEGLEPEIYKETIKEFDFLADNSTYPALMNKNTVLNFVEQIKEFIEKKRGENE